MLKQGLREGMGSLHSLSHIGVCSLFFVYPAVLEIRFSCRHVFSLSVPIQRLPFLVKLLLVVADQPRSEEVVAKHGVLTNIF